MNESNKKEVFCPLEQDVVEVRGSCEHCDLWDGQRCCFADGHKKMKKPKGFFRSLLKKLPRPRRRFRKGGKGLRLPPVWEEWPRIRFGAEELSTPDDGIEYGTAEIPAPEEFHVEDNKKKEKYILPELIKEYWDVEPDSPDWVPESGSPATSDQGPLPDILPEEPQSEPFPPAIGPEPGLEDPLGGMPGFPQDVDGPVLP